MTELSLPLDVKGPWLSRRTSLTLLLAFLVASLCAVWERRLEAVGAADRSLSVSLGIVLPLVAFSFVRRAANDDNLRNFAAPAVRHGDDRRMCVLRALGVVTALLVVVAVLLTIVTLVLAHGPTGPRLRADLFASVPIACAAALAYTACLSAGATFGARGAGSLAFLVFDAVLGVLPLPVAWGTPRGHVRHLLGLEGAASLPQWVSFPALLGFALVGLGILCWRVPR